MSKIKSLMNKKSFNSSTKVYDQIFKESKWYVKTKLKARGIHDVIAHEFFNKIKNKDVLDIGCGYGRFSFLVQDYAKSVTGIDRNTQSILVAKDLQKHISNKSNLEFITSSIEGFKTKKKFDFILLSGTLEHLINTKSIAKKISSLLKRNGTFVSDSPSEFNSRGLIHGSLWKLFDYPMTLSDVDIITPNKMENIFKKFGIQINKNCIGTLYSRAWGENALFDLFERLPNVQKDLHKHNQKMKINNFFDWYSEGNKYFVEFFNFMIEKKILKKIKPFKNRNNPINQKFKSKNINRKEASDYMDIDFSIDPYYSVNSTFSKLSGNIIYYGKKTNKT